jgi:hypothetical protein
VTLNIHDLVCSGRITPMQGAMLYELRRLIVWYRRPWWVRAALLLLGDHP